MNQTTLSTQSFERSLSDRPALDLSLGFGSTIARGLSVLSLFLAGCAAPRALLDWKTIPPLPAGVSELKFSDFFVHPVGDRGLKPTERLLKLDGKRVRILGYMVRQESSQPGVFLLTPISAQVHEHDNGLADGLPASMVHVSVPTLRDPSVPYAPGLMLLTGTLSVGNRTETDGRISVVRLALDPPEPGGKQEPMSKSHMGTDRKGASEDSSQ